MTLKVFWKPKFTTIEFESAKSRDGQVPEISQIVPGNVAGNPSIVYGKLKGGAKQKVNVSWNEFGECWAYYPNARCRRWDLIYPDNAEIVSAQEYVIGLAIFVIMLAIAGLF